MRSFLLPAGLIEAGLGTGMLLAGQNGRTRGAGVSLIGMGALHTTLSFEGWRSASTRHARFAARLAETEGATDPAWRILVEESRLSLESESRSYSFATGAHAAMTLLGLLMYATASREGEPFSAGATLAGAGVVGTLHFGLRLRQTSKLAKDMAVLDPGVPSLP